MVRADPFRLEEVFVNLFSNSAKYGASSITVTSGDSVRVTVVDDGPGIPRDLEPRLFEPFTRGMDQSGVTGSGLGLSIARRLVQAFGGTIDYDPTETGATFVISLIPA
jgi:two-component system sensor histidine kinase KdpD